MSDGVIELPSAIDRGEVTHGRLVEVVVQGDSGRTMYEAGAMVEQDDDEEGNPVPDEFVCSDTVRDELTTAQVAAIVDVVFGGTATPARVRGKLAGRVRRAGGRG